MKRPSKLIKGSKVRIISTARKISPGEVKPAIELLESWGLVVELGDHLFSTHNQFAGTDTERLEDLQNALNDESVDMVWCARGGYGTVKLIDQVDFTAFLNKPKWVVGYSDITSLLCHTTSHLHVESLHATMPINVTNFSDAKQLETTESLRKVLFGESMSYQLSNHPLSKPGDCSGSIIGGNLSIVYSLLGSASSPNTDGKILFLEDLDEYLYHIDRMMVNLKRNGLLDNLSGLLIGGMTDMNDNTVPFGKTSEEIILEYVESQPYPVYFGFRAGHMSPNLTLPFGRHVHIANNTLSFLGETV